MENSIVEYSLLIGRFQEGDTPLLKAVRSRNFEIVKHLLDKGAKISMTDKV